MFATFRLGTEGRRLTGEDGVKDDAAADVKRVDEGECAP